jgi:hypothetical protein
MVEERYFLFNCAKSSGVETLDSAPKDPNRSLKVAIMNCQIYQLKAGWVGNLGAMLRVIGYSQMSDQHLRASFVKFCREMKH